MRRILFNFIAAAICSSAFITGCTTETKDNVHYVNLSQVACSFLGEGNSPLAVDVKASPAQWTATPGATWVKIERTDERTHAIMNTYQAFSPHVCQSILYRMETGLAPIGNIMTQSKMMRFHKDLSSKPAGSPEELI